MPLNALSTGRVPLTLPLRDVFPFLEVEGKTGKPVVYLDTAASAQKPLSVLNAMDSAYKTAYANVHRGIYDLANKATDNFENARACVKSFIAAPEVEEVIFTRNTTEAINMVASHFLGPKIRQGDEIILSLAEHHANIVPWHFLRERLGAKLVWAPVDKDGALQIEQLPSLFSSRTKMVALTHMSNVMGTVTPMREVAKICQSHGVPLLVDGAQAAAHLPVNVQDLGCDFYTFTSHKIYGPTGIGVLWGKRAHLESMAPYQGGGDMIRSVTCEQVTYAELPYKFEAGTPPIAEAVGLAEAIRFLTSIGWEALHAHERALSKRLIDSLSHIKGLAWLGDPQKKRGIFSFTLGNIHPHDVAMFLNQYDVAIRAGHHCAQPLTQSLGLSATCRASLGVYNNAEDIERFAQALERAVFFFEKGIQ